MDENKFVVLKIQFTRQNQIQNMVGKSYMVKDYTYHLEKIMESIQRLRLHNIFPMGTYDGGKKTLPICRKVVTSNEGDTIEVWGDGKQTSFLYVDECVEGLRRLMESEVTTPINVGSEEMISINDFTKMIIRIMVKISS